MRKTLNLRGPLLLALALTAAVVGARAEDALTLGISEGTSGGLDHAQAIAKYQGLADTIGKSIKRKVQVVFVREFDQLEEGMATGRLDLVMARPSDYPARGVAKHGYKFVVSARPDGNCLIVVRKDSPYKTLDDAKGKRWVFPETASYMTKFCTAELRDRGIVLAKENVKYVREQAAITFFLDNKFADVGGIASYSGPAKSLDKSGFRVLHKSIPQPYFPLVAGKRVSEPEVAKIQVALTAMGTAPEDVAVLKSVGVQGFDAGRQERLEQLLTWLGAK
ncbi:phosphate/phosphite/phosphonate ABC transporter substrate-binding protein [Caenimonas terrae]|uniref:Phosphate/phosphite/phosphonate ABC transporter substrate-binding protein n=1 Tax=Caenimonas terrae TaxID=696074 RepID=A0ABW0N765_9BURK